ncbi:MAG: LLM class flavin-dependent oxidoreductase [Anaerolineales bacterium]|nr:LLM class flavin-dependent oxidoreductase [Anaerolineales bacterium]
MKFGLCLPNFPFGVKPSRETIVGIAQAAERLNYDSAWVSDHVLVPKDKPRYGHIYEVLTTMAYLAGMTERLILGTSVLVLPQRDAILAAKQIATLDDLSGGRVIIAVGVGWIEGEYNNLGADFHRRGKHLNEAMQVMKSLWQDDDPQFSGEFYNFKDVLFSPKPGPGRRPADLGRRGQRGRHSPYGCARRWLERRRCFAGAT